MIVRSERKSTGNVMMSPVILTATRLAFTNDYVHRRKAKVVYEAAMDGVL
jgi:hypothetical protein